MQKLENSTFDVAVSFPGEKRPYVEKVVEELSLLIDKDKIFYDNYFTAQLAKPDLDLILQSVYHKQTKLVVVFLCAEYDKKEWPGLEWRAVRDLIKQRKDQIMFMAFDFTEVRGTFSLDGRVDLNVRTEKEAAELIKNRLDTM